MTDTIPAMFSIELPVIQAPMAGITTPAMVVAVSEAGGLGSLPSAMYDTTELREALSEVRAGTTRPINVNFFCHENLPDDQSAQERWLARLAPYYTEAGLSVELPPPGAGRTPFDAAACQVVEQFRPEVVSFHFGLPAGELLQRVQRTGAKVISSATTVEEARWLEKRGVDAIIAMGAEAGGHRGSFLTRDMSSQPGTLALLPQVVDAVSVPVIAAGGITDRRGALAAFALGAGAVQAGTAYLLSPEAATPAQHRAALTDGRRTTAITNVFTGRPARGIVNRIMQEVGPLTDDAPAFPTAGRVLGPVRKHAEAASRDDFTPLWAGEAYPLARPLPAAEVTRMLAGLR